MTGPSANDLPRRDTPDPPAGTRGAGPKASELPARVAAGDQAGVNASALRRLKDNAARPRRTAPVHPRGHEA